MSPDTLIVIRRIIQSSIYTRVMAAAKNRDDEVWGPLTKQELEEAQKALKEFDEGFPKAMDYDKFAMAYGFVYGTYIERKFTGKEPSDGMTPQQIWDAQSEEDKEWFRQIIKEAFELYQKL